MEEELFVAAIELTAEEELYVAAREGNVPKIQELSEKHRVLQARFEQSRTLLHIAAKKQQLGVVEVILEKAPELAQICDSQQSSPLHIAAAAGNVEITKKLLSVDPEMSWSTDCQNMNPIHVAAMNGRVQILEELLPINPLAARERVYRGETLLHLCVKYGQLEALKVLVEKLRDLVDVKDDDGGTILHWAIRSNQLEMIQFLVEGNVIGKDTALKILRESPPHNTSKYSEIESILLRLSDINHGPNEARRKATDMMMTVMMMMILATIATTIAIETDIKSSDCVVGIYYMRRGIICIGALLSFSFSEIESILSRLPDINHGPNEAWRKAADMMTSSMMMILATIATTIAIDAAIKSSDCVVGNLLYA